MNEAKTVFVGLCKRHFGIAAFFVALGFLFWLILPGDDDGGHEAPEPPLPTDGEGLPKPKLEPEIEARLREVVK